MHILIINSEHPPIGGGAGNASAHLAKWLLQLGHDVSHEVTVLTSKFGSLSARETLEGIPVIRVSALRKQVDRSSLFSNLTITFLLSYFGLNAASRAYVAQYNGTDELRIVMKSSLILRVLFIGLLTM